MAIAQRSKTPVGEAATTDTHHIHDAVASGARMRRNDLAKNWHVVAIEKAPAETEDRKKDDGAAERSSIARAEECRNKQTHPEGADEDGAARGAPHPFVREPAADQDAYDRGALHVERRRDACL